MGWNLYRAGQTALLIGLVALGAACAPKRPPLQTVFPHQTAVTIYVAVGTRAAKQDSGNIAAMVDALEADLRESGRTVTVVAARLDEPPPLPRVEIQVRDSDSGDAQLRGAGQLSQLMSPLTGVALVGAGLGTMTVDVYVVPRANQPKYLGRFSGSAFMAMSEEAVAAGERVGHEVFRNLRIYYR